jgi:hypothetical protein
MSAPPSPVPSLSIDIGQAERALRGLLERQLQAADLSFPEWTTLTVVRAGSMSVADLVERQLPGARHVGARDPGDRGPASGPGPAERVAGRPRHPGTPRVRSGAEPHGVAQLLTSKGEARARNG